MKSKKKLYKLYSSWVKKTGLARRKRKSNNLHKFAKISGIIVLSLGFIIAGSVFFWLGTLKVPDLGGFSERKVANSTKIYDRTGEVLLFDVRENIKRKVVPAEAISPHAKNAIVAIEDERFYQHNGIELTDTLRAVLINLSKGKLSQGGSTLTQQVIKNTLLTRERDISRKIKEWILAIKLEKELSKDEILAHYLNEAPYGGEIYGIEEASQSFFGKSALEISLAEAAYLAALPNAPTFFSPYGENRDRLDARKNLVLKQMHELGFIDTDAYDEARGEEVLFRPKTDMRAKALHFVEYVRLGLEKKYGKEVVSNGGLKVVTTLDWKLQQRAEDVARSQAQINEEEWDASNLGIVAIDPKTGHILAMVGSRDYFDTEIDGNFNITTAHRQPGSSIKPFIYAQGIEEGFTPDTTIFDVRTQFNTSCATQDFSSEQPCYAPQNFNSEYQGPMNLRNALGQSVNVVAVKLLYLVGLNDAIKMARKMGITSLTDPARYGLTLVLGGGEVSLLEMTSAYSVFANDGIRNPHTGILRIDDISGETIEEYRQRPSRVIESKVARAISSILSDNTARTPLFGANSFMFFGNDIDVAAKTGTTNSRRDAWLVGYSPTIAVGVWTGNNDNTPMQKGSSISGPTWRAVMDFALPRYGYEKFPEYTPGAEYHLEKPIIRGIWEGGESIYIDTISNKLATKLTPEETTEEVVIPDPHSILHWVDRNDLDGPVPLNPSRDAQYDRWEDMVAQWIARNPHRISMQQPNLPTTFDDVHTEENQPVVEFIAPDGRNTYQTSEPITIKPSLQSTYAIRRVDYFLNGNPIGSSSTTPFNFTFIPSDVFQDNDMVTLSAIATDSIYNRGSGEIEIEIAN